MREIIVLLVIGISPFLEASNAWCAEKTTGAGSPKSISTGTAEDLATPAEGPEDFIPLKIGTVLRYTMGEGIEFVDRVIGSSKGYGSRDISILRKGPLLDLESGRVYRADEDLRKLVIRGMSSALGETTNCEVDPEVVLQFPLKAGKTWETTECGALGEEATAMVNEKLGTYRVAGKRYTQIKSVVEGRKTVKVLAGTFDAWIVRSKKSGPTQTGDIKLTWSYYAKDVGLVLEEYLAKGKAKRTRGTELVTVENK